MSEQTVQIGLDCLIDLCRVLQIPWNIKGNFKRYHAPGKTCTVLVSGKSFTEIGDDCERKALRAAIIYIVKTFSAFDNMKETILEAAGETAEEELHLGLA